MAPGFGGPLEHVGCKFHWPKAHEIVFAANPDAHFDNVPWELIDDVSSLFEFSSGIAESQAAARLNFEEVGGIAIKCCGGGNRLNTVKKRYTSHKNRMANCVRRPDRLNAASKGYGGHLEAALVNDFERESER